MVLNRKKAREREEEIGHERVRDQLLALLKLLGWKMKRKRKKKLDIKVGQRDDGVNGSDSALAAIVVVAVAPIPFDMTLLWRLWWSEWALVFEQNKTQK